MKLKKKLKKEQNKLRKAPKRSADYLKITKIRVIQKKLKKTWNSLKIFSKYWKRI